MSLLFRYTAFLLLTFLLTSCNKEPAKEAPAEETASPGQAAGPEDPNAVTLSPDQLQLAGIRLGKVTARPLGTSLQVNGVLDSPPENVVSISAPLGGYVKSTSLLQGSKVSKGQVVATIENPDFIQMQQDYLEAKGQLELTRAEYERQKELVAEDITPKKNFQKARADYQAVQARMSGLLARIKLANLPLASLNKGKISSVAPLYSPINGYVRTVNVNLGSYVNPPDVLFEIVDPEHLHVELTVFEKDARFLRKGQKIRFSLPGDTAERSASVYLIGQAVGAERSVRVHAHMDREDPNLLPGMYVKATIETGKGMVPALPEDALVEFEGKHYLFTFEGKKADGTTAYKMLEVGKGISENGFAQVMLPEKFDTARTQVVSAGAFSLLGKMKNSEEE